MNPTAPRRRRRRRLVLLLLAMAVLSVPLWFVLLSSSGIEALSSPPPPQKAKLAFLGRWMWPVRQRWHRLRQTVFGPKQVVQVSAIIVELNPVFRLPELRFIEATTNAAGDMAFVSGDPTLSEAVTNTAHARVFSQPRVITVDGMQAQMSMTEHSAFASTSNAPAIEVGYWLNVLPRVRSDGAELTCFFTQSEIQRRRAQSSDGALSQPFAATNAAFGAQARVPNGASLLLLGGKTNSKGNITAVLLTPWVVPKK